MTQSCRNTGQSLHEEPAIVTVRYISLSAAGLAVLTGCLAQTGGDPVAQTATPVTSLALVDAAPVLVAQEIAPPQVVSPASVWLGRRVLPKAAPRTSPSRPVVAVNRTMAPTPPPAPRPSRAASTASTAASTSDGYPYANATANVPDAWGFTQRQCVSYVAWRLSRAGRPLSQSRDGWGSASNWDDTARRLGRVVTSRATVGSVAQWNVGEASAYYPPGATAPSGRFSAGEYGHVAYVTAVYSDGSVRVAQYNATGNRSFSTMRVRAPRFLALG